MKGIIESIDSNLNAINTISLGVAHPSGIKLVWMVVEDIEDASFYENYVDSDKSVVLPATKGKEAGGCKRVEKIVGKFTSSLVIGIRDRDYDFFRKDYIAPDNIYYTDQRDMEMMMFFSDNVQTDLFSLKKNFAKIYPNCISIANKIGSFRIHCHINHLGFSFKRYFKYNKILDPVTKSLIPTWQSAFCEMFNTNNNSNSFLSETELVEIVSNYSSHNDYLVCRGHDLVTLLSNNFSDISKVKLLKAMKNAYSIKDFSVSKLCSDLKEWGRQKQISFVLEN
jgi:hypothetical protein